MYRTQSHEEQVIEFTGCTDVAVLIIVGLETLLVRVESSEKFSNFSRVMTLVERKSSIKIVGSLLNYWFASSSQTKSSQIYHLVCLFSLFFAFRTEELFFFIGF